jgi:hypothetical protein
MTTLKEVRARFARDQGLPFADSLSERSRVHLGPRFTCEDAFEDRSAFAHGARGLVRFNRMLGGARPPTLLSRCRTNDHRPAAGARERHGIARDGLVDQAHDLRTSECGHAPQVN